MPPDLHERLARGVGDVVELSVEEVCCLINTGYAEMDFMTQEIHFWPEIWTEGEPYDTTTATWEAKAQAIRTLARRHRYTLDPNLRSVRGNPVLAESFFR